ncbi:MAG: hypothetical protein AB1705_16595 [Verrucomicrobiota bacterium]
MLPVFLLAGCSKKSPTTGPVERAEPADGQFELRIDRLNNDPTTVEVVATPVLDNTWPKSLNPANAEQMQSLLTLHLQSKDAPAQALPPVAGEYLFTEGRLRLRPRHPLLRSQSYRIQFNPAVLGGNQSDARPITTDYHVPPPPAAAAPRIEAVYPSAAILPANHLKFYVVFTEPMETGNLFRHFKLLDDQGREVPEPFRETELWSSDGKRLTLWFHPGRQKTGVNLNQELGPVLTEGRNYTLRIASEWRSQSGATLERVFEKRFQAGPAQHAKLDIKDWQLSNPEPRLTRALMVQFPCSLDWALLHHRLWVETASGQRVAGSVATGVEERSWHFEPADPWESGHYRLAADTILEDLAGNSLARPFEVRADAPAPSPASSVLYREFTIAPAGPIGAK